MDEHNLASLLATTNLANLAFHPGFSSWLFILVYIEMVEMEQINIGGNKQACAFILGESFTPGGVTHTLGRGVTPTGEPDSIRIRPGL